MKMLILIAVLFPFSALASEKKETLKVRKPSNQEKYVQVCGPKAQKIADMMSDENMTLKIKFEGILDGGVMESWSISGNNPDVNFELWLTSNMGKAENCDIERLYGNNRK